MRILFKEYCLKANKNNIHMLIRLRALIIMEKKYKYPISTRKLNIATLL
jgi:hypothetical protein